MSCSLPPVPSHSHLWVTAHDSQNSSTQVQPCDGMWHFVCVSWISSTGQVTLNQDINLAVDNFVVGGSNDSETNTDLTQGGCLMFGQLGTAADVDCTQLQPGYSYEGYLSALSLWLNILTTDQASLSCCRCLCPVMTVCPCVCVCLSVCSLPLPPCQMNVLQLANPAPLASGLLFCLSSVVTYSSAGALTFWNDSSGYGFAAAMLGVEAASFINIAGDVVAPLQTDLDLWLTFDAGALTNNANDAYPTFQAPPASPAFVLDRSGRNNTANVTGNVTFGGTDGGMSALSLCNGGVLTVPGLVGRSWSTGFTATAYFKRTVGQQYQTVIGNGMYPQASWEIRALGLTEASDDVMSYASFMVCNRPSLCDLLACFAVWTGTFARVCVRARVCKRACV